MFSTRTDKILNSTTAKDYQGLVRTCQVLDQSLQVPLLALQVLDQSLPILGNPGDTLPRTGTRKKSKTDSGLIRAEYVLYLVEKKVIGCSKKVFSVCYLTKKDIVSTKEKKIF